MTTYNNDSELHPRLGNFTNAESRKKKSVCETKETEDFDKLWHSNEKRKILCARKHFLSLGVDYRPVNDKDSDWYITWDEWRKMNPSLFE